MTDTELVRVVEDARHPWARDVNQLIDLNLGNLGSQVRLVGSDGIAHNPSNPNAGAVVSSGNPQVFIKSAAGIHEEIEHSASSVKVWRVLDAGAALIGTFGVTGASTLTGAVGITGAVTITGAVGITGNTTMTGTLNVSALTTLAALTANGNVILGDNIADTVAIAGPTTMASTLGVTLLATFAAGVTLSGGVLLVPVAAAATPSIAVGEATTGFFRQAAGALGFSISGTERGRLTAGALALFATPILLDNNTAYRVTESDNTTIREAVKMDTSNILQVGVSGMAGAYVSSTDTRLRYSTTTRIQVNSNGIGFFEAPPDGQQSVGSAATDLASVISLANDLRDGVRNLGLFS